jgi:hypothetical protein
VAVVTEADTKLAEVRVVLRITMPGSWPHDVCIGGFMAAVEPGATMPRPLELRAAVKVVERWCR